MIHPILVHRRQIWFPTIWGWLVLLLIGATTIVLILRNLHAFLAMNQPVAARVLVVEGWMDPEGLDQAIATIRSGGYQHVVTTGGPTRWSEFHGTSTLAERAADYLIRRGLAGVSVTALPVSRTAQDRTYLSALMVRGWVRRSGLVVDAIDVYTSGTHARRSRLLYRLAFGPDVIVGVHAARSSDYDADAWWRTTTGARDVLDQAIALFWTKCFFWP